MFATLVPKGDNLITVAGICSNNLLISVLSPDPPPIEVSYKDLPQNFRAEYCFECPRYQENNEYESSVLKEDFFDEEGYKEALQYAKDSLDRDDYKREEDYLEAVSAAQEQVNREDYFDEYDYRRACRQDEEDWYEEICSGGSDIILDDACSEYSYEEVLEKGTLIHETVPHIYQFSVKCIVSHNPSHIEYNCCDRLYATAQEEHTPLREGQEPRICFTAYQVGNVFSSGLICWGQNQLYNNARYQYNLFWTSSFNGDLTLGGRSASESLIEFRDVIDELDWQRCTVSELLGDHRIVSNEAEHPVEGVLFIPIMQSEISINRDASLLTWIFRDETGYFAYDSRVSPAERIDLTLDNLEFTCNP